MKQTIKNKFSLLIFKFHVSGTSAKDYSKKVMIYKPFLTHTSLFTLHFCDKQNIVTVTELLAYLRNANHKIKESLDPFGITLFEVSNVYIQYKGYMFGISEEKEIRKLFHDFKAPVIRLHFFYVPGGASREYRGYHFIIHSDETIHKHSPHVHVEKGGVSPRYSLETFLRYPEDKYTNEHLRDEKKIIIPYIKKHKKWFLEKWMLNTIGYIPPIESIDGRQFCKES